MSRGRCGVCAVSAHFFSFYTKNACIFLGNLKNFVKDADRDWKIGKIPV